MSLSENNPTTAVRAGEELDWVRLDHFLKSVLRDLRGEPDVMQFAGGNSNLTYRLRYENHDLVLRRPPFGTKARTAHSMSREYRIMTSLKPVFPSVPETLAYSDDESIIGSEFYLMNRVDGQLIKKTLPERWRFNQQDTRRFCIAFWEKLIELHQVDIQAAGLQDFGKPEGYVSRQVLGWNSRFERAVTPDVNDFADVRAWLESNRPPDSGVPAILHGDYRIDNVILDADDPCCIRAVLDWEICALGDPLMDLGNSLAYWIQADDPEALKGLAMQPSADPGMLTRKQVLDLYQQRTGLDIPDFTFYLVFGYWRLAVILQQIYFRYFHGQTEDQRFRYFGVQAQCLGDHCRELLAL